jgi:hypothetical protein
MPFDGAGNSFGTPTAAASAAASILLQMFVSRGPSGRASAIAAGAIVADPSSMRGFVSLLPHASTTNAIEAERIVAHAPERMKKSAPDKKPRVYAMSFASIYPMYVQKAEKKGRTKAEVDKIIFWLTGHTAASFKKVLDAKTDLETFYEAPRFQPKARLITGVVCGVRVEDIEDITMRRARYLDKLIDELAKGKAMEKILREPDPKS